MSSFALTLPEALAAAVRAGRPILPIPEVPQAGGLDAARPVRLLDPHGEAIAAGLADPENGVVRVIAFDGAQAIDHALFRQRVEAALALRRELGLIGSTCCRLINREGDQLSGFTADLYGEFAVVNVYARGLIANGRLIAEALREALSLRGVVIKVRSKGAKPGAVPQELLGDPPPEKLIVEESGVPFEVHLSGGTNVGLFTDMREHRRGLGRFTADRRVLNCFAYTGALSVTAARGGASSVTSVDLSSGALRWAAENFRLSGLDPESPRHRFEASDVLRYLQRSARAGARYDLVILDPPTYSAARASEWSMRSDYPEVIAAAIAVLRDEPGGLLWLSANSARERRLIEHLSAGIKLARREAQILEIGGLPPDYPTVPGWPEGRYLDVCFVRLGARR